MDIATLPTGCWITPLPAMNLFVCCFLWLHFGVCHFNVISVSQVSNSETVCCVKITQLYL